MGSHSHKDFKRGVHLDRPKHVADEGTIEGTFIAHKMTLRISIEGEGILPRKHDSTIHGSEEEGKGARP